MDRTYAVVLLCICLCTGLRVPDRIVTVYASFNVTVAASPSRFMSLFDPILPIGVLLNCMQVSLVYSLLVLVGPWPTCCVLRLYNLES